MSMANFTKQQLKDATREHYHQLTQKWEQSSGETLSDYLKRVDSGMNFINDFVEFLIDKNFNN